MDQWITIAIWMKKSENGYISSYSKYNFRDNFIGDLADSSFSNRLVPQLKQKQNKIK
jgi:hypothetical protein